jgi:peptidoglycan/xylan/chitin deacetylase (PgdA/CDA1 family)
MTFWPIAVPAAAVAGAGLATWGAMHPAAQLFGPTVCRTGRSGALALTFDDGPNPAVTPRLLDLLDQHRVRATFFLIGRFVRACPALAREIAARGHTVGNHTDTHPNLVWLSRGRIREELTRCQESIAQATGGDMPHWMRPPYGFRGPQLNRVARQQGFQGVVMWSVIAFGWKPQPASHLIERLRCVGCSGRDARGGDIIVLHDGDHRALGGERHHILAALDFWLPRWRDASIKWVTLDGMTGGAESVKTETHGRA